uniref:Uncharacterized protein n=1 Tax=Oryza punctata TaxID=4537 RepID=A0A0E0MCP7_ORYPU
MADSSSTPPPPPSFIGYLNHYSGGFPAPVMHLNGVVIKAYGMGGRGELVMTVSGGGSPENAVVWTTVAEPGHWFYVPPPPSGQSGGVIMINSMAVAGGATGSIATQSSGIGTGVFIPEPRIRIVPRMQQPINWVPLVPDTDFMAPPPTNNGRKPELKTADAGKGKGVQMSYAAAVRGGPSNAAVEAGPSHEAVREDQSQQGHKFSRQKKSAAATAAVEAPTSEKKEEATDPTVEDIPELALLPEEWVY